VVVIGKTDQFEHLYKEKLRSFIAQFGQFVSYERDIAARDLGLHLTRSLKTGGASVSSCLCWFQLKGIMPETLPKEQAEKAATFPYELKVEHLRFWFLQPMPTYLALYIGSLDSFFILNLQKYVEDHWGRDILTLQQKTATVQVPKNSTLDAEAFDLILRESTVEEWSKALSAEESKVRLCQRDYNLIWSIGTAAERKVEQHVEIFDWQSKTRGEIHFEERPLSGGDWEVIRNHWEFMLSIQHVEDSYPYLDFSAEEEAQESSSFYLDDEGDYRPSSVWGDDYDGEPYFKLKNGELAAGSDVAGEYHLYYLQFELNDVGHNLFQMIKLLLEIKFIEISDDESGEFISVAPWHSRHV
jgi:hypothetical protein